MKKPSARPKKAKNQRKRTMGTKPKKRKRKIRVKTGAKVVKKDSVRNDTLPRMQAQPPRTVAPVLKIKVRKK